MARDHVDFEIDLVTGLHVAQCRDLDRIRNQVDRELAAVRAIVDRVDGQAHAVDRPLYTR
ncbi:hypothetical protein WL57_14845 [Burkholderia cepacia]|nr:hypothetical protein WL57_14845 [Burkholderia cepacia]